MSQIDRNKEHLYPPFAEVLGLFEADLAQANLPFYLFEGFRTPQRQLDLFMQGRGAPGPVVTWALPFSSFHHFGLAGDYVLDGMIDRPGVQWSWDTKGTKAELWLKMARIAKARGLEAGYYWSKPDLPHLQMKFGYTMAEMRSMVVRQAYSIHDVWELLDQWLVLNPR